MYKIVTKKGCQFCEILKACLTELSVDFEEKHSKVGAVPKLFYNDELVFTGLPDKKDLVEFVYGNN